MYLDFDNFTHVNNTYGHTFGDKLLQQVGQKLKTMLDNNSFLARQSGDEFSILYEVNNKDEADLFIKKFLIPFLCPL